SLLATKNVVRKRDRAVTCIAGMGAAFVTTRSDTRTESTLLFSSLPWKETAKMRTTYSTLRCNLLVALLFATIPLTSHAVLLTEWPLPPGSHPLQIDASSPSRLVYFVDQGTAGLLPPTVNQLNQGLNQLTQWMPPFLPTVPGGIVVDQLVPPNFVYVTDLQ